MAGENKEILPSLNMHTEIKRERNFSLYIKFQQTCLMLIKKKMWLQYNVVSQTFL